jgi:CHAP domain
MTRHNRAILFPCAPFILTALLGTAVLSPAYAAEDRATPDKQTQQVADPIANAAAQDEDSLDTSGSDVKPSDLTAQPRPSLANIASIADSDPPPSVETPLHHLYCVEYARIRSGFQIFGDAKTWWYKAAQNLYTEIATPAADTVMVFAGSHRITRGHVAVVTKVLGPREIRVDQANWENHGEIDHNTPVLDVSPNNDWSEVRVWNIRSGQFGAHVYAIKGFIQRTLAGAGGDAESSDDSDDN